MCDLFQKYAGQPKIVWYLIALLLAGRICIISIRIFVNFNENIRKELKILKIQGGILTKLLLSLLIIVLE